MLTALADDFLQARQDRVARTSGHSHTMTTEKDVREHVAAYWRSYRDYLPEMAAISDAAVSDPDFAEIRRRIRAGDVAIWRAHIKELRAHLGKPVEDSTALAQLVVSLLENHCYTTLQLGVGDSRGDSVLSPPSSTAASPTSACSRSRCLRPASDRRRPAVVANPAREGLPKLRLVRGRELHSVPVEVPWPLSVP